MAYSSNRNKKINTQYFQDLTETYKKSIQTKDTVDIITFVEAKWGLNTELFPVQRFILKVFYGLELDDENKTILLPDETNVRVIGEYTEKEFMQYLIDTGRTNLLSYEPGRARQNLLLNAGRRGTKCQDADSLIYTTVGNITCGEFLERIKKGEKIGLFTFKKGYVFETYDVNAEDNGVHECLNIETEYGYNESTTLNHPYLVWNDDMMEPKFVEAKDIKVGDMVASPKRICSFGQETIGKDRAKMIGYLFGDGCLTDNSVCFTNADETVIRDLSEIVERVFPTCFLKKCNFNSNPYTYRINKKKFCWKVKNPVVVFLEERGLMGHKAINKFVPECIFNGSREEVVGFLNGLYACDGFVSTDKSRKKQTHNIHITLGSKKLIYGIQILLKKFGIVSNIRQGVSKYKDKNGEYHCFDSWKLTIYDNDSKRIFCDEIGITGKEDKLAVLKDSLSGVCHQTVPYGVWNRIHDFKNRNKVSLYKIADNDNTHSHRIRDCYKRLTCEKAMWCANGIMDDDVLREYCNGSLIWNKVEKIINLGMKSTVAIEIGGTHVIASNLITHNSSLTGFISNYETYKLIKMGNPQRHFGMPDGSEISVTVTAPTIETATTLFTTMKNYCMSCNYLKDRVVGKSSTTFTLSTDNDLEHGVDPTIRLVCGGAGSADIRGRSNIVVIMDEAAFFNASGANSGEALFTALTPSIVSFTPKDERKRVIGPGEGKTILISSPFGKSGIFYSMYLDSFKDTENTVMFSMYTTMLNPTVDSGYLRNEKRRNPELFSCEFCAKFSDSVSSWVNEETMKKVIDERLPVNPRQGRYGVEYYMGIDYAGKNDGAAVSIVHLEGTKIVLDYADVFYGALSDVWLEGHQRHYESANRKFADYEVIPMEEFADEILRLCSLFPIRYGWFDQFNGYGLMEMLRKRGLSQFDMKSIHAGLNQQMYQMVKEFINSELILIPNHPILVPEMSNLEETKIGPRVVVEAPNRAGFHDDITDSFVVACYGCYEQTTNNTVRDARSVNVSNNAVATGRTMNAYRMNKMKMHGMQNGRGFM